MRRDHDRLRVLSLFPLIPHAFRILHNPQIPVNHCLYNRPQAATLPGRYDVMITNTHLLSRNPRKNHMKSISISSIKKTSSDIFQSLIKKYESSRNIVNPPNRNNILAKILNIHEQEYSAVVLV